MFAGEMFVYIVDEHMYVDVYVYVGDPYSASLYAEGCVGISGFMVVCMQ